MCPLRDYPRRFIHAHHTTMVATIRWEQDLPPWYNHWLYSTLPRTAFDCLGGKAFWKLGGYCCVCILRFRQSYLCSWGHLANTFCPSTVILPFLWSLWHLESKELQLPNRIIPVVYCHWSNVSSFKVDSVLNHIINHLGGLSKRHLLRRWSSLSRVICKFSIYRFHAHVVYFVIVEPCIKYWLGL